MDTIQEEAILVQEAKAEGRMDNPKLDPPDVAAPKAPATVKHVAEVNNNGNSSKSS